MREPLLLILQRGEILSNGVLPGKSLCGFFLVVLLCDDYML